MKYDYYHKKCLENNIIPMDKKDWNRHVLAIKRFKKGLRAGIKIDQG